MTHTEEQLNNKIKERQEFQLDLVKHDVLEPAIEMNSLENN